MITITLYWWMIPIALVVGPIIYMLVMWYLFKDMWP
jgi:hypothetical protein